MIRETKRQNNTRSLKIRWQRLVSDGQTCPRCKATEEELDKAISILKKSLTPLNIEVILEKEELPITEFKKNPLRSNQIWINERLLEEWIGGKFGQSPCCDVCGPSECRTVEADGKVYEEIPSDLIIKAAHLAVAREIVEISNESCCQRETKITKSRCC
ncbi:MAG: DUF2703 domain-containing protein [Spirochaetes bacterium]|nr:DUF2703 domain-containing protein [Spirochaetota bacterium]